MKKLKHENKTNILVVLIISHSKILFYVQLKKIKQIILFKESDKN